MNSAVLTAAHGVVREFTRMRYDSANWESLITKHQLLETLGVTVPAQYRPHIAARVAHALRSRFPELSGGNRGKRNWDSRTWLDREIAEIIKIVLAHTTNVADWPSESELLRDELGSLTEYSPLEGSGESGFVAWRHFRARHPMPDSAGVYLLGLFDAPPAEFPDPSQEEVIYIGETGRTITERLGELESTACVGSGHPAGYWYRLQVWPGDYGRLSRFHKTYVSWRVVNQDDPDTPMQLESRLIGAYEARWSRLPLLNKKPGLLR